MIGISAKNLKQKNMMTDSVQAISYRTPYLDENVIHCKLLSPRIFQGAQHLFASMSKIQLEKSWQKTSFKIFTRIFLASSYLLTIQISLIEGAVSGIFCMIGAFSQLIIFRESAAIEKYSAKALACSLHSLATLSISIPSLIFILDKEKEWAAPKKHTVISMLSGTAYLSSAALAQLFCTTLFNSIKGKKDGSPLARSNQAIIEGTPIAFANITRSLEREYSMLGNQEACDTAKYARDYIAAHPPSNRNWLNNFNLDEFICDHVLSGLSGLVDQYMQQNHFIESNLILETETHEVILAQFNEAETKYHEHLKTCVKEAVKKMHEHQWAKYLDIANSFEEGWENLENYMADCTIPLSNIAQLIEIEGENRCPKKFSFEKLKPHNQRKTQIDEIKFLLNTLTSEDRELLIERLIKTSLFELGSRNYQNEAVVDQIYQKIFILAGNLHQGTLLTLPTIDTNTFEGSGHNYFCDCWGEGIKECLVSRED
ncbi:putative uncharacterized protein [Waddlia chondrophila 2032/99]|uniref:Uncharacterized protein n=3 Tax=Waddlia chondrophila TaxID=71667 RepID=D6YRQ5_WADCW|nr:hypothetical protein wcw_1400 [Waddlia chondrophila WSU 86-1044]CCB90689.1 putative uncharacterized protein [Waddlia chondrophila 2032/99]